MLAQVGQILAKGNIYFIVFYKVILLLLQQNGIKNGTNEVSLKPWKYIY